MNQNHSNPYFHPSFTFLPPNPNPNFSNSLLQNPELPLPPNSIPPSKPNLLTTLSNLNYFIDLAENTVNAVSNLLNSNKLHVSNEKFSSCPFDSRHRMPIESLFRHSLCCSSSPRNIDLSILDSLHYPNSIKPEDELKKENRFVQSMRESDADLCFSIDDYGDFGSNFFYKDCPGVVSSSELDITKRTFTLPSVLSVHCANFVSNGVGESKEFRKECLRILPSELWGLRSEVEGWNDYPQLYSFAVLRGVSCIGMIKKSDLLKWVILNSPRYGILIDVHMRDHIFVLLKLCLKAVSLEACRSSELLLNSDSKEENGDLNLRSLRFSCPVLFEAMTWLASQLSVLYGEVNGRFFSINMLKHCILNAASSLLLFPLEEKMMGKEGCGKLDGSVSEMSSEFNREKVIGNVKIEEPTVECERDSSFSDENTSDDLVFVSQVAAAVAALHERSLLEEKIKGLRSAGSLSKSQLLTEYSNMTMRADEERSKRSNYRPILEHDGLLWQRSRNQDSSKTKTREELLAEERDYKRRRMSYRGKKAKRSITEVMRDIIEDHMEEIKQAGGIGCFVKGSAESGVFPPGSVSVNDMNAKDGLKRKLYDSPEASGGQSHSYRKQLQFNYNNVSTRSKDAPFKDHVDVNCDFKYSQQRQRHGHNEPLEGQQRSNRKEKRDREYRSRSPESYRSRGQSHEKHRHRREQNELEVIRTRSEKNGSVSSHRSKYRDSRSSSSVSRPSSDRKYSQISESRDQYRGRMYGSQRSESVTQTMFEDRYDPSESDSRFEDACVDESSGSKYVRPDKLYSLNDDKYNDEMQRINYTETGHYHTHHKES